MKILVFNNGSSNCKLSLFDVDQVELSSPQLANWTAMFEWKDSRTLPEQIKEAFALMPTPLSDINVIGHRIVHGGNQFTQPVVITSEIKQKIRQFIPLAPIHLPRELECIEYIEQFFQNIPQIGVFDTAFHSTLSEIASTYSGPYNWKTLGIKRYGFHGLSYEYCSARCSALLKKNNLKIVCCHLGNGSSLAAIDHHRSIDTTMGFTPLEGVMMGSRCGSIDPGILLFLQTQYQCSLEELIQTLYFSSGLRGISGVSNDMREIIQLRSEDNKRASLSFDMYIHSLKRNIGAMVGVLNGFDALVFTGGIGQNSPLVRQKACKGLQHFGVILDEEKNDENQADTIISSKNSSVQVVLIASQEDWCIACTIKNMRLK